MPLMGIVPQVQQRRLEGSLSFLKAMKLQLEATESNKGVSGRRQGLSSSVRALSSLTKLCARDFPRECRCHTSSCTTWCCGLCIAISGSMIQTACDPPDTAVGYINDFESA